MTILLNSGVRLLRTNLTEKDVQPKKEQLTQALFDHIPVGVGSKGMIPMNAKDLDEALEMGMDWSLREGYVWAEDKEHCEEYGRMLNANPAVVSMRAKKRGLPQLGTLGAGNHYAEIQVVDEIFDKFAANRSGLLKSYSNYQHVARQLKLFFTSPLSMSAPHLNSRLSRRNEEI